MPFLAPSLAESPAEQELKPNQGVALTRLCYKGAQHDAVPAGKACEALKLLQIAIRSAHPKDVRERAAGRPLSIPIGSEIVYLTISSRAEAIRFLLEDQRPE
jgi:hypothetical protein